MNEVFKLIYPIMSSRKGEASIKSLALSVGWLLYRSGGVLVPTSNRHLQYVRMKFGIGTILVIVGLKTSFSAAG